jgi:biopolymer transport protein ExbB/TolQ
MFYKYIIQPLWRFLKFLWSALMLDAAMEELEKEKKEAKDAKKESDLAEREFNAILYEWECQTKQKGDNENDNLSGSSEEVQDSSGETEKNN